MPRIRSFARDLRVVGASVFVSAALGAAPAMAAYDALNTDAVDGKHAVGAGAPVKKRAGKLVATDKDGYLPDNIVRKVANATKLGGRPRTAFVQHLSDKGELQTGMWASSGGTGNYSATEIEFPERLRGSFGLEGVEVHNAGDTSTTCPGPGKVTKPAYLCVYVTQDSNASLFFVTDPSTGEVGVSPEGFILLTSFTDNGYAYGSYAVRSPN